MTARKRMAIFDMDNTILAGRFIDVAARHLGFAQELEYVRKDVAAPVARTENIARFLAGVGAGTIGEIADSIPVVPDFAEVVSQLRDDGYVCGIISDSYTCVATRINRLAKMDFVLANCLEFVDDKATGRVIVPSYFLQSANSTCEHQICKCRAVEYIANVYAVKAENIIAVGDSENDICMLKSVGKSVAFCPTDAAVAKCASFSIDKKSFRPILSFIKEEG